MAGAFSGALLDSYHTVSRARPPFAPFAAAPLAPSQLSVSGGMSWNPAMHGSFHSQPLFTLPSQPTGAGEASFMDLSQASALKIAELQAKLDRKLGPEYVSQRPGPGGNTKLTYAEGWKIINLANEVFGFNGWSSSVVSLTVDFVDEHPETKRVNVGVTAVMRVTLRDGVFHEDVGYGILENSKSKGQALDKCKKEAVTDGVKRALRNFGNLMGNCLYDKEYTKEIVKIKVPPPKFERSTLHRRPEFADPPGPQPDPSTSANTSYAPTNPNTSAAIVKPEPGPSGGQMAPPPAAMRSSTAGPSTSAGAHRPAAMSTPKGKAPERAPQTSAPRPPSSTSHPPARAPPTSMVSRPPPPRTTTAPPTAAPHPAPAAAPAPNALTADEETQEELPGDGGDDSFAMYSLTSDDDVYLAAVDLSGGGGTPYHHTNANTTADTTANTIAEPEPEPEPELAQVPAQAPRGVRREGSGPAMKADRLSLIAAAISAGDAGASGEAHAPALSRREPQQQRFEPTATTSAAGAATATAAPRGMTRQPSLQRLSRGASPANAGALATSTPRAPPSMGGGFNFPAGFTPPSQKPPFTPPVQGLTLKRNVDAMQSAGLGRRPQQGMGLSHQPPAGGSGPRRSDPPANGQLGEGGDQKRMRR